MKSVSVVLALAVSFVAAQVLPTNEQTYRIAEINGFNFHSSMTAQDKQVVVRDIRTDPDQKPSQLWVVKELDTQDNTTALWNPEKQKYVGYDGSPRAGTFIKLVDTPVRFQLIPRTRFGFQIAILGDAAPGQRLVMVRQLTSRAEVWLQPATYGVWNFTAPP